MHDLMPIRRLYIIRNGRVAPEFKAVKASTLAIAGRSISTLIKTQGIGDLYQMYELAQRNRVDYNVAYIPGDFPTQARKHSIPNTCRSCSISASDLEKAALSGKRPRRDWATFDDDEIRHSLERNSYPPRATSWDCANLHHLIVAGVMNLGLSLL